MNLKEVAKLLTIASAFDRREVDEMTVSAWQMVPQIAAASYEDAVEAVIAHQSGPHRHEYLTVGHLVDALPIMEGPRSAPDQIAADVRSAKARKIIAEDWPRDKPLNPEDAERLANARRKQAELDRFFESKGQ